MSIDQTEAAVAEGLVPELQAAGYEVFLNPRRPLVPAFFGSYLPDLIALRPDRNVAVEVTRSSDRSKKLSDVAKLFEGRSDWELRIVLLANQRPEPLPRLSMQQIAEKLAEAQRLASEGHDEAAFLFLWAVFEAAGRALLHNEFQLPQTPGRLIEVLAAQGVVTPDEADMLRPLAKLRNRLVHGEIDLEVPPDDVSRFAAVLRSIIEQESERGGEAA